MRIDNINSTSFNAIKVDKLKPLFYRKNITFYNDASAMLNKPRSLFYGAQEFINAIRKNLSKHIYEILDEYDIARLTDMLKYLPKEFSKRKLLGIIGSGVSNTALLLDNHEVLCISDNIDTFENRAFEDFDLPIKSIGRYPEKQNCGWFIRDFGLPVTKTELNELANRIKSKGYILCDWRTEQACRIGEKIYLLDYECAMPKETTPQSPQSPQKNKNSLRTLFSKILNFFKLSL